MKPLINHQYNWHTKASSLAKEINLQNKVVLITGATNGIGLATSKALLKAEAKVIVAVRNLELAKKRFQKFPNVIYKYLDLANIDSIRSLIKEIKDENWKIDYLINNAGVMGGKKTLDENGLEKHFKVNYLASFILTMGLINSLVPHSRIINLSSVAHKWSRIHFEDINFASRTYNTKLAYGQSKTAAILFTQKLANLLANKHIETFSVHPGIIPLSNLWSPKNKILKFSVKGLVAILKFLQVATLLNLFSWLIRSNIVKHFKTNNQGASTTLWSLISPEISPFNGAYLEDCNLYPLVDPQAKVATGLAKYAHDPKKAQALWDYSLRLLKKLNIYEEIMPNLDIV